ncbi:MAG: ABC transporter permease [Candidatus Gottesmanbacteria bacterium]
MNWNRIVAIMIKSWYSSKRDVFRIFDIFWWPAFELFIWGLFSVFISKTSGGEINIVSILLGAVILWTFFDRASRDMSLAMIDELWNKNFINLFSSPLTVAEYLIGVAIVSTVKLAISIIFMFFLAHILYGFQITSIGLYIIPSAIGLTMFGWTLSLVVQAFIIRFGHTVEVFIWAVAVLVQPLSCVFYPLATLPTWARTIAMILPSTYLFENMRTHMSGQMINWGEIGISFGLNALYLVLAMIFFYFSFEKAKQTGKLIQNY